MDGVNFNRYLVIKCQKCHSSLLLLGETLLHQDGAGLQAGHSPPAMGSHPMWGMWGASLRSLWLGLSLFKACTVSALCKAPCPLPPTLWALFFCPRTSLCLGTFIPAPHSSHQSRKCTLQDCSFTRRDPGGALTPQPLSCWFPPTNTPPKHTCSPIAAKTT